MVTDAPTTPPAFTCPPEAYASVENEPLPPRGMTTEDIVKAMGPSWRWLTTDFAAWARENATLRETIKAKCEARQD